MCRGLLLQLCRWLLSLLTSPPVAIFLFSGLYFYFFLPASPSLPSASLLEDWAGLVLGGVASALNAWHLHGCWLFPLVCVGVWPLWLMAWVLNSQQEQPTQKLHSD